MKFKKLDENTIQCEISRQEMWEMGLEVSDFIGHRSKAEEVLQEILEEAKYEFDISNMGPFVNVQIAVMPEGDVTMTISPMDEPSDNGLLSLLKHLTSARKSLSKIEEKLDKGSSKATKENPKSAELKEDLAPDLKDFFGEDSDRRLWVQLDGLDECIFLSKQLLNSAESTSSLYKWNGQYFMLINCCTDKYKAAKQILAVSEHSSAVFLPSNGGNFIEEHGKPILVSNAIAQLSQM